MKCCSVSVTSSSSSGLCVTSVCVSSVPGVPGAQSLLRYLRTEFLRARSLSSSSGPALTIRPLPLLALRGTPYSSRWLAELCSVLVRGEGFSCGVSCFRVRRPMPHPTTLCGLVAVAVLSFFFPLFSLFCQSSRCPIPHGPLSHFASCCVNKHFASPTLRCPCCYVRPPD